MEIESYYTEETQEKGAAARELLSRMQSCRYDGLVMTPLLISDFDLVVQQAKKDGIPLVLFNEGASIRDRLFYYGPNNYQSGLMAGELVGRFTGGTGGICVLVRTFSQPLYSERLRGFCDQLSEHYPGIKLHSISIYERGREAEALLKVLENYPDLRGLYVMDSTGGGAFASLLREWGRNIPCIVGHEGDALAHRMLAVGLVTALLCEQKVCQGYYPVKLLYEYLVQGTLPKESEIYSDINIVIRENLSSLQVYQYGRGYR